MSTTKDWWVQTVQIQQKESDLGYVTLELNFIVSVDVMALSSWGFLILGALLKQR